MIFIYLISAVVAILFMKFYLHKRRIMKYVGHLPAPPEIPIVGSGLYFLGKNAIELMDMLCSCIDMFGTPCRIWLGPVLAVVLGKPEDVKTVLLSPNCLEKPYIYRFTNVNLGLFAAPIHVWKPHRKLLNPTFNNKILLSFIPIFNEKSRVLAEVLGKSVGEKAFDISKQFLASTLELVCATSIGCDLDFQSSRDKNFLKTLEIQSALVAKRMIKFWLHPEWIYKWTDDYRTYQRGTSAIFEIAQSIRERKQNKFNGNCGNKELEEDEVFSSPQIYVDELLKLHHKKLIDLPQLDNEIVTILVGGTETSALTMSHTILLLAMHPEVQERAFQEIKDAHKTQTSDSDAEILAKLDYLEMCIKESMRHFPVAPTFARQNMEDIQLSDCTVPKGTMLLLSTHYLHRNKEVWGPNADMFNPDNFLPEKVASRHAYSYIPFSGGARNCIGIKYAWLSMKIMLCAIMRQYKFSTHLRLEDIVTKFEVTLKIDNGNMVTVERREKY